MSENTNAVAIVNASDMSKEQFAAWLKTEEVTTASDNLRKAVKGEVRAAKKTATVIKEFIVACAMNVPAITEENVELTGVKDMRKTAQSAHYARILGTKKVAELTDTENKEYTRTRVAFCRAWKAIDAEVLLKLTTTEEPEEPEEPETPENTNPLTGEEVTDAPHVSMTTEGAWDYFSEHFEALLVAYKSAAGEAFDAAGLKRACNAMIDEA